MTRSKGLTLIETLIALLILAIALGALGFLLTSNMAQNRNSGLRTQAVQILNYLGRRVVGADSAMLPAAGSPLQWGYGSLQTAFPDLANANGVDLSKFRAMIQNRGAPSWRPSSTSLTQYRVEVCWQQNGHERCVEADTISSAPTGSSGTPPPLPGIN